MISKNIMVANFIALEQKKGWKLCMSDVNELQNTLDKVWYLLIILNYISDAESNLV